MIFVRKNKNKNLILLGHFVSSIGDDIYLVALTLFVIDKFASAEALGLIMAVATIPQLLFGFFVGQIVDRLKKKWVIVNSDFLRALSMLIILIVIEFNHINILSLSIITFLLYSVGVFFDPAVAAIIPKISENDEDIKKLNSAITIILNLSSVFGPVIGALLYGRFGFRVVVLINLISFVLSAISELFIDIEEVVEHKPLEKGNLILELTAGFRVIWSKKIIRKVILIAMCLNLCVIPFFEMLLPLIIKTELGLSDEFYGSVLTARAVGTIVGSFIIYKINIRMRMDKFFNRITIAGGLLIVGIGLVSLTNNLNSITISLVIYILLIMFGIIGGISNVPINVAVQQNAPENRVASTFSTMSTMFRFVAPSSLFVFSMLSKVVSTIHLGIFCGCFTLIVSLAFLFFESD